MTNDEIYKEIDKLSLQAIKINKRIDELRHMATINVANDNFDKFNEALDNIFAILKPDVNVVLLSKCYGDRADLFDGYCGTMNLYPDDHFHIESEHANVWCNTPEEKAITDEYIELMDKFCDLLYTGANDGKYIIPDIKKLYGNSCSINFCWSGYIALTRDHKVVNFICREDNLMQGADCWTPTPIYDFYKSYDENMRMRENHEFAPMPNILKNKKS